MKRLGMGLSGALLSGALLLGSVTPVVGGLPAQAQGSRYDNGYRGSHPYDDRYDRGRYQNNQGGIGPGKGALIGAGAGALLGGLIGGGLKGALIGGAVGAGGGAIVGKAAQDNRQRDYRDYNNGYYHGYRR
jgi:hypothetical protein